MVYEKFDCNILYTINITINITSKMGSGCSKQPIIINIYIVQESPPIKKTMVLNKNDCNLNDEVVLGLSDDSIQFL